MQWKLTDLILLKHKKGVDYVSSLKVNCFKPPKKISKPVLLPSHVSISCFSESVEKFYCSHEETEITGQAQLDDHPSDTWPISLS